MRKVYTCNALSICLSGRKHIQFSINKKELIFLCNKFSVREGELGVTLKALHLENDHLDTFPTQFMEDFKEAIIEEKKVRDPIKIKSKDIHDMSIKELNQYLKDIKTKELEKFVGITERNIKNPVDSKGLYSAINLEHYSQKFFGNWNRNFNIIPELINRINLITKEEAVTAEIQLRKIR